jgi:hypothetical protein
MVDLPIRWGQTLINLAMSQTKPPSPRSFTGCLLKGVGLMLLIAVGAYYVQQMMMADVDPDKTRPVIISQPKNVDPPTADAETLNLPDGAITASINQRIIDEAEHPFNPLLKVARQSIEGIDKNIRDYKATLVSQVFVDGKLQPKKYLECKIRHAHTADEKEVPFSVYTCFLKPKENVGQEAIWVDGQNDGKLIAHATGLFNVKRFYLDPDGAIAMDGNRYPIRQIGFRNLIVKMAEKGEKDRQYGECRVKVERNVEINGCVCTMLQAVHPIKRDHFDFFIARIYIDDERNIPVAYEGFLWPEEKGGRAQLLEKYYYTDIELNVGLTDEDFDPGNEAYNYPSW